MVESPCSAREPLKGSPCSPLAASLTPTAGNEQFLVNHADRGFVQLAEREYRRAGVRRVIDATYRPRQPPCAPAITEYRGCKYEPYFSPGANLFACGANSV
jgi:hypothetical protein